MMEGFGDEKVWIPHKYIKLVMDFEKMRKYPWGLHSFDMLGDVFPCISTSGNFKEVIIDAEFARTSEMKDESVDLIIDMQRNKYDWSKHVWAYKETVKPFQYNSEEDGSDEEAAVETSDTEIEDEIESTRVSPAKKRKNRFQDTGAESRKKRLLCQRSTEKYRDLEEEMKSYIQSMFNSSFTALGLKVREVIEDRFIKLEEKILSFQTQGGAPANTQTRGADPFWTPFAAAAAAAAAPVSVSARARAPTQASIEAPALVSTSGLAPSCSAASAPYRCRASATAHSGGPANAAKTRSQTKDADLSDVFGSLFSTFDVNVGTQEHLQKTMGNLTQESNVDGFDPSQDKHEKYDWSKHVWAYKETVKPFQYNSEEDGSDEEAVVETSDTEIEDEIESTHVSPAKKRKNRFRDTGAESRKKRLLFQRSTEKYRDLEEEMKSYIQSMFNSSFTTLGLEVREVIEDRFIKLEEKILSSQTQGGAPANTQTRGADPFWTPSAAASAIAPASVSARAPAPTPASTEAPASVSTSGLSPSRSEASSPYRSPASATAHTGGPANAAKTWSQT
ncbi:hypothetical protein DY000_02052939 [Brassica cretica]|uniref:DUF1985 domain-containing protein n=1 Tax=Brassica cretica TaxID=69181 RepID=A0ABQ7A4F1_BRACR|nr:hypothetical protein DY000_02052939 [Brassica cretica]